MKVILFGNIWNILETILNYKGSPMSTLSGPLVSLVLTVAAGFEDQCPRLRFGRVLDCAVFWLAGSDDSQAFHVKKGLPRTLEILT